MAQNITSAAIVTVHDNANNAPVIYVDCNVRMPASEYATFIVTGTLTNLVPAATTTYIAAHLTSPG